MEFNYQVGSLAWHRAQLKGIDVEVSYNGLWWSLNDHVNYRMNVDGFGQHDLIFNRKTATSEFFDGEYLIRMTAASVKRNWSVYVYGGDQAELEENFVALKNWFTQLSYNVRISKDDLMETIVCEPADFTVDEGHVYMHNSMKVVKLSFSTDAKTVLERIL